MDKVFPEIKTEQSSMPVKPTLVGGLTKREYYAACAMQGILAAWPDEMSLPKVAATAVRAADRLIEALNE